MLLYGRERQQRPAETWSSRQSEAASFDFPAESFDAAPSRFGIIFEREGELPLAGCGLLVPGRRW